MAHELTRKLVALKGQGRTVEEIAGALGTSVKQVNALLLKPELPEGHSLVHWTDNLGAKYYEVLPPEQPPKSVQPRAFRYLIAPEGDSYIRVFIPDDVTDSNGKPAKFIEIFPFSDVHWGHKLCDKGNFILDVKEVEKRPNRFCILNGDNMENSLGDSAGGAAWAEQSSNPADQRTQLEEVFRRVAHKTLSSTPGNHEIRSENKTLMNPLKEITKGLGIPYFSGPYNMEIVWRGYRWTFHMSHGGGASNTPGGKLAMVGKSRNYNDVRNFIGAGHVHDEMTHRVIRIVRRREFKGDKLVRFWKEKIKEYKMIFPSYLLYDGSYAEKAGYSPGSRNTLAMQMYANGDYYVVSSKRQQVGDTEQVISEEIL